MRHRDQYAGQLYPYNDHWLSSLLKLCRLVQAACSSALQRSTATPGFVFNTEFTIGATPSSCVAHFVIRTHLHCLANVGVALRQLPRKFCHAGCLDCIHLARPSLQGQHPAAWQCRAVWVVWDQRASRRTRELVHTFVAWPLAKVLQHRRMLKWILHHILIPSITARAQCFGRQTLR